MKLNGLMWWIPRWRKSTAYTEMNLEQQAAYRNLLDEGALRGGAIPNNDNILAKACGDPRRWPKVRGVVLKWFTLGPDGYYRNDTLDEVIATTARRMEKQARYRKSDGRVTGKTTGALPRK
jgi:hypothetical protein